jgi:hypothetical protein
MNLKSTVLSPCAAVLAGVRAASFAVGVFLSMGGLTVSRAAPPVSSGLILHLDASVGVFRDTSDRVIQWADQSLSDVTVTAPAGARPQWITGGLNGRPVVRFDGGPDHMALASPLAVIPSTLFAVFHSTSTPVGGSVVSGTNFVLQRGGLDEMQVNEFFSSALLFNDASPRLISTLVTDATHIAISANGQQVVGGNPNFIPPSTLAFVGQRGDGVQFLGDVAEIALYDRALSLAEEHQVGRYLADKYGLASGYVASSAEFIAFTSFNEPTLGGGDYMPGEGAAEVGFTTTWSPSAGGQNPLAGVITTSPAHTPILSHISVAATTTFDAVELSGWSDVSVGLLAQVRNTSYEAGDFLHIYVTDGNAMIDLVSAQGGEGGGGSLNTAAGRGYAAYSATIPAEWARAQLVIESFSNSSMGSERFDFDNIRFSGIVPEPVSVVGVVCGQIIVGFHFWVASRRRRRGERVIDKTADNAAGSQIG